MKTYALIALLLISPVTWTGVAQAGMVTWVVGERAQPERPDKRPRGVDRNRSSEAESSRAIGRRHEQTVGDWLEWLRDLLK